jgi:hypothetical protein
MDPLIIFRCKNPQCRQTFKPAPILNDNTKIVVFKCPICGSKYKARYITMTPLKEQETIMLTERPKMVYQGTRIASS